jgi:hypothetical protein
MIGLKYVPLNFRWTSTKLYSDTSRRIAIFTVIAVETSNPTKFIFYFIASVLRFQFTLRVMHEK